MTAKEVKELNRRLTALGWDLAKTGSGHWLARPPDGGQGEIYADTPSDHRAMANTKARLRRRGVDFDADPNVLKRQRLREKREDRIKANLEDVRAPRTKENKVATTTATASKASPKASPESNGKSGVREFPTHSCQEVMRIFASEPGTPFTAGDISAKLHYHRTSATKAQIWLLSEGLIEPHPEKIRGPNDKRRVPAHRVTNFGYEYWCDFIGIQPPSTADPKPEPEPEPVVEEEPQAPAAATVVVGPEPAGPEPMVSRTQMLVEILQGADDPSIIDAAVLLLKWEKAKG